MQSPQKQGIYNSAMLRLTVIIFGHGIKAKALQLCPALIAAYANQRRAHEWIFKHKYLGA